MSLTKVSYSLINGSPVNIFDYLTTAQIAEVQSGNIPTTDLTTAFNSAIAQIRSNGGGQLVFPPGKYCGQLKITTSNIEVIGYGAEIGFQNIDASLQIYPPNPSNAIPYNYSFVGGINAGVPNNVSPNATFYSISSVTQGNDTISVLSSAAGLTAGDWCMLMSGQNASSSTNNHVPVTHQIVKIRSVAGLNVTLEQMPDASFTSGTTDAYLVKWTFLQNVIIRGATFNSVSGAAYLYFVCGTYNCLIEDVKFIPQTQLGIASTSENVTYRNVTVVSGHGGLSSGRMCDNITVDTCRIDLTSSESGVQNYFFFGEENVKKLNINNCKSIGGGVVLSNGTGWTDVTINDSEFNVYSGVNVGLGISSCADGTIFVANSVFAVVDGQEPSPFPPATPSVCVAISSTIKVQFVNSQLIQLGTGDCYVAASGSIAPSFANTYVNSGITTGSNYVGLINSVTGEYQSWMDQLIIAPAGNIQFGTNAVRIISGLGDPNGTYSAAPGSLYLNASAGAGTGFYVKESGTGNTGWVAK